MRDASTRGDALHGPAPTSAAPARASRGRRLAAGLVVSLAVLGPWPVDDASYVGGDYQARTLDRIDAAPRAAAAGPIRVGVAEVDLTPRAPRPLAGFIGGIRTPFVGVDTPCSARALTVESGSGGVTILTADLLLVNAKLARAVVDKAGLRPEEVYFTASHTHGGPGGWGDHPLEMLVAGAYDAGYFDELASQLAGVVRESRATTVPAEIGFVEARPAGRQRNRVDPALPTHDALSALVFRPPGAAPGAPPLAILAVFGAHATVSHPVPPRLGGDYPAALARELKRRTGAGAVLFAAGAVGDASPARPAAKTQRASAEALGAALAGDLAAALPSARFAARAEVASLRLDVDLPVLRLPFFAAWARFSPAASWWIAGRRTHLHALRLGPAVLVGFPGDYSGHLAGRLTAAVRRPGPSAVATSFDGDFKGYFVSGETFRRRSCYETRWMSFYGPWAGDYLTDLGRRMVDRLSSDAPSEARPARATSDLGARVALGGLLASAAALGRRRARGLAGLARRLGRVTSALVAAAVASAVGFVVAPGSVDWAVVGLPAWSRPAGLAIGLLALAVARFGRGGPGRAVVPFAAACFLLSASWLVPLAVLRARLAAGPAEAPPGRGPRPVPAARREAATHQS